MTKTLRMLAGSILVAMSPYAIAQASGSVDTETERLDQVAENHGQAQVATRIASDFTRLAGSRDNALALVRALRNGTEVTLTSTGTGTSAGGTTTTTSTSFTPPTGKMGWGNVFISLALAQNSLAQLGITKPTAAQLQAALVGGSVTLADGTKSPLKGVLTLRAGGMGWGQIAQAQGTRLGPVVSAIRSTHGKIAQLPASSSPTSTTTATNTPKSTSLATASAASRGLVTASGGASVAPRGQGIVTAAGGSGAGTTAAASHGHGSGSAAGLVSASGATASGTVTTAGGSGADNGKGHGKGRSGG